MVQTEGSVCKKGVKEERVKDKLGVGCPGSNGKFLLRRSGS